MTVNHLVVGSNPTKTANNFYNKGTKVSKQFDLEQQMMHCWSVVDDLKDLNNYCGNRGCNAQEVLDVVNALATVYQLKFELMFETFEELLAERREEKNNSKLAF